MAKNLVLAAVGDESLHPGWLRGAGASEFDLFLVYYGDVGGRYADDAKFYVRQKGKKWRLFSRVHEEYAAALSEYDAIMCADDDLQMTGDDVALAFRLVHEHRLDLAQPSLREGSYVLDELTRQRPYARLRYTNWVELMAPIFSRRAWALCAPTFAENDTAWGLDSLWPKLLHHENVAILDEVAMVHTRPFFSGSFYDGTRPLDDARALREKYGLLRSSSVLSTVLRPDAMGYVQRLFAEDLPRALAASAAEARAIGARYRLVVTGQGEWTIDASPSGPSVRPGAGRADCTVVFVSGEAFLNYLEEPTEGERLFFEGRLDVSGKQVLAWRLPRVFGVLFPYGRNSVMV